MTSLNKKGFLFYPPILSGESIRNNPGELEGKERKDYVFLNHIIREFPLFVTN